MSKQYEYKTHFTVGKLHCHNVIKNTLLDFFQSTENNSNKDYDSDVFHKLDWDQSHDFNRPWVRYFIPIFNDYLSKECLQKNMSIVQVNEIWFQQYKQGGEHGWHTHGSNYTGVYYLELPKSSPHTELISENGNVFVPKIKEGDVLIFPSFISHRAPPNYSTERKSIISFNVDFNEPIGIFKPNTQI